MQVLSLSELSVCDDSPDRSSLLAQIAHLQAQLSQLQQATHTTQQLHYTLGMTGISFPHTTHTHIPITHTCGGEITLHSVK